MGTLCRSLPELGTAPTIVNTIGMAKLNVVLWTLAM
jgi:hypothetical protein